MTDASTQDAIPTTKHTATVRLSEEDRQLLRDLTAALQRATNVGLVHRYHPCPVPTLPPPTWTHPAPWAPRVTFNADRGAEGA